MGGSAPVEFHADGANFRCEFLATHFLRLLKRNILVVAANCFCRWRENRLRQPAGFEQPVGQQDSADFPRGPVVFPSRARNVAAHDAFNRQRLCFSHEHGPAREVVAEFVKRRGKFRGAENMVGDDVLQQVEPEK